MFKISLLHFSIKYSSQIRWMLFVHSLTVHSNTWIAKTKTNFKSLINITCHLVFAVQPRNKLAMFGTRELCEHFFRIDPMKENW